MINNNIHVSVQHTIQPQNEPIKLGTSNTIYILC